MKATLTEFDRAVCRHVVKQSMGDMERGYVTIVNMILHGNGEYIMALQRTLRAKNIIDMCRKMTRQVAV